MSGNCKYIESCFIDMINLTRKFQEWMMEDGGWRREDGRGEEVTGRGEMKELESMPLQIKSFYVWI